MTGDTYIYGIHPLIEALRAGKEIEKVFIQSGLNSERLNELKKMLYERGISPRIVPSEKLRRLTSKAHQGVIAIISAIQYQDVEMLVPFIYEKGEQPFFVITDRVTDVRNFGAIARTASCAGVHGIIFPEKGSAMINADAIKASAGALNSISVCRSINFKQTLQYLRDSGIKLIACTEKASVEYTSLDYTMPVAIILGSEEDGISPEIIRYADDLVRIPIQGNISSLNVSVATAVIVFEAVRQRKMNF